MALDRFTPVESSIRVMIVGVGGEGCQTVNYAVEKGIQNLEIIAIDTDIQSLLLSSASIRILIGEDLTHGQGTSGNVDIGQIAAEEASEELENAFPELTIEIA